MNSFIDPTKYYNLSEILEGNFFAWIHSLPTLVKWIERDREEDNILKANYSGEATGKRYFIKGENIIQFLAKWEDGNFSEERKEEDLKN